MIKLRGFWSRQDLRAVHSCSEDEMSPRWLRIDSARFLDNGPDECEVPSRLRPGRGLCRRGAR